MTISPDPSRRRPDPSQTSAAVPMPTLVERLFAHRHRLTGIAAMLAQCRAETEGQASAFPEAIEHLDPGAARLASRQPYPQ